MVVKARAPVPAVDVVWLSVVVVVVDDDVVLPTPEGEELNDDEIEFF